MIRRPTVALFLAVLILGTLTITAFAVSMPAASAPKAADLPRIVTDKPVSSVTATVATATPKPSKPPTPPKAASSTTEPGTKATASNSNDPDNDGDDDTREDGDTDHDAKNHEVVRPKLHESDEDGHKKD